MIKAVIFDFDDTITDNRLLDFESFNLICKKFNIKNPLSLNRLIKLRVENKTAKNIILFIKRFSKNNFSTEHFLKERSSFLLSIDSNNFLKLKPGTFETIQKLKKEKILICLCSVRQNKKIVIDFLNRHKLNNIFDLILCGSDIEKNIDITNSDNRILLKASFLKKIIQKYKINSNNTIFIGNSHEDYIASTEHKIIFLKFDNDYLPKDNFYYSFNICNMKTVNKIIFELNKYD